LKIYAVGGAVRDKQLGLPVKDQDWVVVGTTQQQMLAQGFKQVGRDFRFFYTLKLTKSMLWHAPNEKQHSVIKALKYLLRPR